MFPRPLTNCLHCFTLRQGTTLIAIVQLFAVGILVTFCILALTHAIDIREMVARDAEDTMDRGFFEDDNSMRVNIERMKIAGCNARDKVDEMWYHLMFGLAHLFSIVLLMWGVLTARRRFMAPWLYLNTIDFVMIIVLLMTNKSILNLSRCMSVVFFASAALINFYSTYAVWSTYMSLNQQKGLVHEIHDVKKKQTQSITECSASTSRLATKPYEV